MRSTKLLCMTGLSALSIHFDPEQPGISGIFRCWRNLRNPNKQMWTNGGNLRRLPIWLVFEVCAETETDEPAVKKLFRKRLDSTLCTMYNGKRTPRCCVQLPLSKQFVFHGSLSLLSFLNAAWKNIMNFYRSPEFCWFSRAKKADVEHFLCCYRYFLVIQDKSVVYTSFAKPDPKAAFVSTNSAQTFEAVWCESSLCGISWSIGNVKPKAKLLVTLAEAHADERTGCANKIIVWWERVS